MASKITILFVAAFAMTMLVSLEAGVIQDGDNGNVIPDSSEESSELDKKIQQLREKVAKLIETGKENEKAFQQMTEVVRGMDNKVKEMTQKLKKINSFDYTKGNAKDLE